ncbi:MarR family winged helix-turn-helix transcriptional regulator [Sandaracinobacter sp.]|uniref:MarR family winged helix-turn-helix transcriptional regulator n=1 Tax=Sandaracinobacter sp. TaxID=2487581 RepID=UPI0035B413DA
MLRLRQFLPYRLSLASNAVSDRVANVYQARFGLKIPEWRVIAVVAEQASATQAALVAATQMDKMTISRAVAALVERGLLARARASDRRTLELALTAEGEALYAEIAPLALGIEAELLEGFSPAERTQLMALLQRLEACAIS